MSTETYRVSLQQFEGPLDLLLFLIQRDEIDIFDIPVARITDEYLEAVRKMEEVDLDGVADFLYLASLLISIKVRMLLPAKESEEEEEADPREELVARLLEYMRYKEAAEELGKAQDQRAAYYTRGQASAPAAPEPSETLTNTTVFELVRALRRVLAEAPKEPSFSVPAMDYSLDDQRKYVLRELRLHGPTSFAQLVRSRDKAFIITTFLAVLEMAQSRAVAIEGTHAGDDFMIARVRDG